MASAHYSKAVMNGLKKHGLRPADVARITGLTESRIQAVLREKAHFTDGNLSAIEQATGRSAGQLAMATLKPDRALSSLINGWAALRSHKGKAKRIAE